ncbi:sf3b2 [Bugula neritina]|uniref:Sf3b2 n=1 Tax=Bugula neritina TaxID=10212 RepID=A0A7J7JAS3_BUGNE|nr:sf3b2 [Bugula neritina]
MADTIRKVKNEASFRSCMSIFVHSRTFTTFIFAIIIINTALLVLQTFESVAVRADWYFSVIDSVFLGIYILELVLKLYVLRRDYFRDNWNVLDFIIVIVNILDYILPLLFSTLASGKLVAFDILRMFKIFKAIRALRVLRAISLFVAVLVDNFQLTLYAAYGDPKDKTVKIEEDDTLYDLVNSGDDDSLFEGDNSKKKMPIEEAYPTANEWEKTTLKRFFQILPAIEYNMYVYQQQQTTLNLIVDLCAEIDKITIWIKN